MSRPRSIVTRDAGPRRPQQEGHLGDSIFHASAAESRDGTGSGDDPEELGTKLGGVEASAGRRELPQRGKENRSNVTLLPAETNFTGLPLYLFVDFQLRDFDKDNISDRTLRAISKYTANPEFVPAKIEAVSVAAMSLCIWVIAMEKYGKLFR